jgi:hypothetical protein
MERFVDSVLLITQTSLDACDEDMDQETSGTGQGGESVGGEAAPEPELTRPSEYLRARCPLCFGGKSRPNDK